MHTVRCERRLQRYFDKHYGQYEDSAEWFVDHAPNEWRFFIPELEQVVTLICSSSGEIVEKVIPCKYPKLSVGPDYKFVHNSKSRKDKADGDN